jgi:hypothetical protein
MARYPNDDERHAAIRLYLLCLNEQNRASESVSGGLSRTPPSETRSSSGRPAESTERYPVDRGQRPR